MLCPHCGYELPDQATFCPGCNKIAIPSRASTDSGSTSEPAPKRTPQKLYPPQDQPSPTQKAISMAELAAEKAHIPSGTTPPKPAPAKPASAKSNRRLNYLCKALALITLIALSITIYITATTRTLRVDLTKAQTERAAAQATVESLGKQVSQLEETLESTRDERDTYKNQATSLQSQVNAMESTVSQSTYDKDAAQRELEQVTEEKDALAQQVIELETSLTETQEKLTAAETERDTLQKDNNTLQKTVKENETEIGFYDSYVVFVMLSSDNKYYHKYDCADFTQKNFLAYSTKLAEANGYSPCPKCCE